MRDLELLAPARNADIGIAAIDCGADAVYIAGPAFGARQAAGNTMDDIARLCTYARCFGARIFLTLNTILYDRELPEAERLLRAAKDAGVDAVIVQDLALAGTDILPLHASTQCAIRTPEEAAFHERLGFRRLVLERQISLEDVRRIRAAVGCELEFFVHGALCASYSGQCYLSEQIAGRSANRGACIQACRALYDLVDAQGRVLERSKALLSLKDLNLISRLDDLARAGVVSFKIEGRLKNISYVRNTVRAYSLALDRMVDAAPQTWRRTSFGRSEGGFTPQLEKTFNRGYTQLFLDGKRGPWAAMEIPKSMGEEIGTVTGTRTLSGPAAQTEITLRLRSPQTTLRNGDGFSFALPGGGVAGFRGDVCTGQTIRCQCTDVPSAGTRLFRNYSAAFEREMESDLPRRLIPVQVEVATQPAGDSAGIPDEEQRLILSAVARSADGREVRAVTPDAASPAANTERMEAMIRSQVSKTAGIYTFHLEKLDAAPTAGVLPYLRAAELNALRRALAEELDRIPCRKLPFSTPDTAPAQTAGPQQAAVTYQANVANRKAEALRRTLGAVSVDPAYELAHQEKAELMRMKYCLRYELGLCPVHQGARETDPLFLLNNGRRYALRFDCAKCEMTVSGTI